MKLKRSQKKKKMKNNNNRKKPKNDKRVLRWKWKTLTKRFN